MSIVSDTIKRFSSVSLENFKEFWNFNKDILNEVDKILNEKLTIDLLLKLSPLNWFIIRSYLTLDTKIIYSIKNVSYRDITPLIYTTILLPIDNTVLTRARDRSNDIPDFDDFYINPYIKNKLFNLMFNDVSFKKNESIDLADDLKVQLSIPVILAESKKQRIEITQNRLISKKSIENLAKLTNLDIPAARYLIKTIAHEGYMDIVNNRLIINSEGVKLLKYSICDIWKIISKSVISYLEKSQDYFYILYLIIGSVPKDKSVNLNHFMWNLYLNIWRLGKKVWIDDSNIIINWLTPLHYLSLIRLSGKRENIKIGISDELKNIIKDNIKVNSAFPTNKFYILQNNEVHIYSLESAGNILYTGALTGILDTLDRISIFRITSDSLKTALISGLSMEDANYFFNNAKTKISDNLRYLVKTIYKDISHFDVKKGTVFICRTRLDCEIIKKNGGDCVEWITKNIAIVTDNDKAETIINMLVSAGLLISHTPEVTEKYSGMEDIPLSDGMKWMITYMPRYIISDLYEWNQLDSRNESEMSVIDANDILKFIKNAVDKKMAITVSYFNDKGRINNVSIVPVNLINNSYIACLSKNKKITININHIISIKKS